MATKQVTGNTGVKTVLDQAPLPVKQIESIRGHYEMKIAGLSAN